MKSMRVAHVSLLAALACGAESTGGDTDLRQLWLETAPQQYVARVCSTGFIMRTCTVSAVDEGQAVATQAQLGGSAWEEVQPAVDVVEGMLNAAERDAEEGCQRRVTQHEAYAIPSLVYRDCGEEGWGIELSCFAADTLDLARCR